MVEVFKTSVIRQDQAALVLDRIHAKLKQCKANFDLQDCDRILRVEYPENKIDPTAIIGVVRSLGFEAEILPDEVPGPERNHSHLNESPFNLISL